MVRFDSFDKWSLSDIIYALRFIRGMALTLLIFMVVFVASTVFFIEITHSNANAILIIYLSVLVLSFLLFRVQSTLLKLLHKNMREQFVEDVVKELAEAIRRRDEMGFYEYLRYHIYSLPQIDKYMTTEIEQTLKIIKEISENDNVT